MAAPGCSADIVYPRQKITRMTVDVIIVMKRGVKLPGIGNQPAGIVEDLFHIVFAESCKACDQKVALYLDVEAVFLQYLRDQFEPSRPFDEIRGPSGEAEVEMIVSCIFAHVAVNHVV